MRLAKYVIHVGHERTPPRAHRIPMQLARAFRAQDLADVIETSRREPVTQHSLTIANDRVRFTTDPASTRVEVFWPDNDQRALALGATYLERGAEVLNFQGVESGGYGFVFVQARPETFDDLAAAVRDVLLRPDHPVIAAGHDYSAAVIIDHDRNLVNLSMGAVRLEELGRWGLTPPPDGVQGNMLLADVSYVLQVQPAPKWAHFARVEPARRPMEYARSMAERFVETIPSAGPGGAAE